MIWMVLACAQGEPESGPIASGIGQIGDIAVHEGILYYTDVYDGELVAIDLATLERTVVADGLYKPEHLTVAGSHLAWTSRSVGRVESVSIQGGDVQNLFEDDDRSATLIVSDGDQAWFTSGSEIWTVPVKGGSAAMVIEGEVAFEGLGLHGSGDLVVGTTAPHNEDSVIGRVSGEIEILAERGEPVGYLAVGGDSVYWAEGLTDQDVYQLSVDGGSPSQIDGDQGFIYEIVADEVGCWWATLGDEGAGNGSLNGYEDGALRFVGDLERPTMLALDDSFVYFAVEYGTAIWSEAR